MAKVVKGWHTRAVEATTHSTFCQFNEYHQRGNLVEQIKVLNTMLASITNSKEGDQDNELTDKLAILDMDPKYADCAHQFREGNGNNTLLVAIASFWGKLHTVQQAINSYEQEIVTNSQNDLEALSAYMQRVEECVPVLEELQTCIETKVATTQKDSIKLLLEVCIYQYLSAHASEQVSRSHIDFALFL